jgi:hypothetical protein
MIISSGTDALFNIADRVMLENYWNQITKSENLIDVWINNTDDVNLKSIMITITNSDEYKYPLIFNNIPAEYVKSSVSSIQGMCKLVKFLTDAVQLVMTSDTDDVYGRIYHNLIIIEHYLLRHRTVSISNDSGSALCSESFCIYDNTTTHGCGLLN